jgi:hypothetical protein
MRRMGTRALHAAHHLAPAAPAAAARFLAALRGRSYLAVSLGVIAAGCTRPPAPPAPSGPWEPVAADSFLSLAARTVPTARAVIRLRWRYDDGNQEAAGRAAARLAPPDSLRLDVAVPVVGRATLVLAGDSSWAEPDKAAAAMPQSRAVLWALFGIIRRPAAGTRVESAPAVEGRLWRLTAADGGVTVLECRGDTLLGATELKADRVVGRLRLTRDAAGAVAKADATDFEHGVRFIAEVEHRETSEPFPAEIWRRP